MTEIMQRIPAEIWVNVFQHLDTVYLCQCRLVCQSWNHLAEEAIFHSGVYLTSENSAKKLHQLLLDEPRLPPLIKKINSWISFSHSDTLLKLIEKSFTSNMEEISVDELDANAEFFATLIDAAEKSPDKRFRLKKLPSPQDDDIYSRHYIKAAQMFRQSLENLEVPLNCEDMDLVLNRLEGFSSLTKLELNIAYLESVQKLDTVLKNCHQLCELKLTFPPYEDEDEDEDDDYITQDEADLMRWAVEHVKQVDSMKRVVVGKRHLDLVHYLIYKYPSMESFACHDSSFYDKKLSLGLLNAAKELPKFSTRLYYHGHQELQPSISSICALHDMPHNISASFIHSIRAGITEDYHAALAVETARNGIEKLHLGIALDYQLPSTVTVDILEHLRTTLRDNYAINELTVNAVFNRPREMIENDELLTLYYILNNFPALKCLELSIQKIQHEAIIANTQLEKLTIEFAEIDAQVLPQISQQLPRLYLLDINTCSILDEQQRHQDNIYINVPNSSLALLQIGIKHGAYSALSQEEFEARPNKEDTVAIIVTCASIARIHLNIDFLLHSQINIEEFVLRKLQVDIEELRTKTMNSSTQEETDAAAMELEDRRQKHSNYLAKSNVFNEKLSNISWLWISKGDPSIIKDLPKNNEQ
ncbi:hypothetical protein MBANPS3_011459 [Mucor bainieri]